MLKRSVGFGIVCAVLAFFSICAHSVLVQAQTTTPDNGIEVNLGVNGVPGCNNNNICESNIGETPLNCSTDCFQPSSGGSGGFINTSPGVDTIPPQNPRNVQAIVTVGGIALLWLNPPESDFAYIRIMRNEDHFYGDPFSGTLLYEGRGQYFLDKNVVEGRRYYYTLFSRDSHGNFSSGSAVSAVAFSLVIAPIPPVIIPGTTTASLSYLVHQYNQKVQRLSPTVPVTINDHYTIIIDTESLIPSGDYMTVTGPDGKDMGQYTFAFNRDSGRFQSVIPPLEGTGTYTVHIIRFNANTRALIATGLLFVPVGGPIIGEQGINSCTFFDCGSLQYVGYILLLLLLILILALHHRFRDKSKRVQAPPLSTE